MHALDAKSRTRAWVALVLGLAGIAVLPAAIEVARRSKRIGLLDAGYAIPLAFLLGLLAFVMARRAKRNLQWLQLREGPVAGGRAVGRFLRAFRGLPTFPLSP